MTLKTKIALPILMPYLLKTKSPNNSDPSSTAPLRMVIPIPAPKNKPPKIAISNLSSVMVLKAYRLIERASRAIAIIDLMTILLETVKAPAIRKGTLKRTSKIDTSQPVC
jgi:hypothetical protein